MLDAAGSRSHRSLEAVGRLGGYEFVALLPELHNDRDSERVAERIDKISVFGGLDQVLNGLVKLR